MALPQPRAGLMDIPLYEGGRSSLSGHGRVIKLSSNASALGPSPRALEAYEEAKAQLARYPDGSAQELRNAIAEVHELDAQRIICGAGSDEILGLICRAYAGPGDEVIHTEHGFLMYELYTRSVGATPVAASDNNITVDIISVLENVTDATRAVFIANPNNPTGTYIPSVEVERLRSGLRDDIILVLDGAYAEFMTDEDYEPGLSLAASLPNTIMTRTFSKIYGLASLRVGWAYAAKSIIDTLNRIRSPFNVNMPALAAAAAAIRDTNHTSTAVAHNIRWMRKALDRLRALGLEVKGESANFILPRFPEKPGYTAADANKFLQRQGIIVRRVTDYGLPHHLRITLGTDAEMNTVLAALTDFMGGKDG